MERLCSIWLSIFTVVFISTFSRFCEGVDHERQVHIVYMGALPEGEYQPSSHHVDILREVIGPKFVKRHLIRSYKRSFNGFAAYLNEEERQKLLSSAGVVSVFPNRIRQLQTTRSWDFMGFPESSPRNPTTESNVIVGLIDTGIWPESESFSDKGLGPVPSKWKGVCEDGQNFTCNKKVIGARSYNLNGPDDSPRDIIGHGSHTASIAAGNSVKDVSFYGLAKGTARGGVPSSRIAVYKVCRPKRGCADSDVLAAFDDAISDGVDIISISIGGGSPIDFYQDSIAIGAFHAMERGILTVHSAGNEGSNGVTTSSVAPWLLSVAASTIDRRILNKVILGNSAKNLVGNSIDTLKMSTAEIPLIYGADGTSTSSPCLADAAKNCDRGCLDRKKVKGKIVVCDKYQGMFEAHAAGAVGSIVMDADADSSYIVPLPAASLSPHDMKRVKNYMNSTKTPKAKIFTSKASWRRDINVPLVVSFSSRGPNTIVPDILKPDLTAPGVEILAAFSPDASVSDDPLDGRSVKYSILSGTSMSCPHAAGAAAYVKSFHPDWSPSAIKSALMTTAREMNRKKNKDAEFSYGAGHIDPVKAANPGLVYDTTKDDYIKMVCSLNYDLPDLGEIFGGNVSCPKGVKMSPKDLNYPSMSAHVDSTFRVEFERTVTNVGRANSTYKATLTKTSRLNITVEPNILSFKSLNERKSFLVTVSGAGLKLGIETAALIWSDGCHRVRSPIVLYGSL